MYLTNTADIQIGDLVITSGLDDRYPSDYPVAEITSIKQISGDAFVKVEAKPLVDLNSIREVLLIWPSAQNATLLVAGAALVNCPVVDVQ